MLGALSSAALRHRVTSDTLLRLLSAVACVAMIGIGQSRWAAVTMLAHVLAGSVWTLAFAKLQHRRAALLAPLGDGPDAGDLQTVAFASMALAAGGGASSRAPSACARR